MHSSHVERWYLLNELIQQFPGGLGYKTPTPYRIHTEFSSHNRTVADSLWEALDSSPIVVALSDTYAQAHGLDLSARFPWDDAKGIYHIKAFHHMHCLVRTTVSLFPLDRPADDLRDKKNIRKAYIDYQRGEPPVIEPEHFHHCIDPLRQDLMCLADDTPMPTINELHKIGNGQCRDWDRLIAWMQEPERHACFRMLSDYRRVPHTLEQFAFCDKGSPHRAVADQYFEKWGHKDPFGE